MPTLSFGYRCQECGKGTVREQVFYEYKTKLKGLPLTVDEAHIGVCESCGARHFDPNETTRWRRILDQKYAEHYLQPTDIRHLQESLGFSRDQFASFLGCTRQSLYNWERPNRTAPQSRMADLFMRLVRESRTVGKVNVLEFLTEEAGKLGLALQVSKEFPDKVSLITNARKTRREQPSKAISQPLALAAETETCPEEVILESEDGQQIGRLVYDFLEGELKIEFLQEVPFDEFDAEIWLKDGTQVPSKHSIIQNGEAVLLEETRCQQDDIAQVRFIA